MKLEAYLEMTGETIPQAASAIGVSVEAVRNWINGTRIPSMEFMCRIYEWSLGHVTPNDFYELPRLPGLNTPGGQGDAAASHVPAAQAKPALSHDGTAPRYAQAGNGHALPGQLSMFPSSAEVSP